MDLNEFIENFADQFDDEVSLTPETVYSELEEWSSMTSLAIIAMVDDEYDVQISSSDLRECKTVSALFERVKSLKA